MCSAVRTYNGCKGHLVCADRCYGRLKNLRLRDDALGTLRRSKFEKQGTAWPCEAGQHFAQLRFRHDGQVAKARKVRACKRNPGVLLCLWFALSSLHAHRCHKDIFAMQSKQSDLPASRTRGSRAISTRYRSG